MTTTTTTTARTCAAPGCSASLEGRRRDVAYCGERCRKRAAKARERASRPRIDRQTIVVTRRRRAARSDPEQTGAAAAEAFRRALRAEAEASLVRDPQRQPWRTTADVRGRSTRRAAP